MAFAALRANSGHPGRPSQALAAVSLFVAVAGLIYLPWGLKNYLWTGNPMYPLFDNWFNPAAPYEMQSMPPFALRKLLYGEKWWEILLVPLRIFFQGQDDSPQYFDGKLNPALLVLPIAAFMAGSRAAWSRQLSSERAGLVLVSILFILFVFFQTKMRIRYVGPVIPCLVILSMVGLENLCLLLKRRFFITRPGVYAGVISFLGVVIFVSNLFYLVGHFNTVVPL